MHSLITVIRFLRNFAIIIIFIGMLGFLGDIQWLRYLTSYVFLVVWSIEVILTYRLLVQDFLMLISVPYLYIKYLFKLPSIDTYKQENEYSLPFEGEWLIINGGISKKSSHSWHPVLNQRYAYDFIKVDEYGKSYRYLSKNTTDYYCYSQNILAPADGIVVEIRSICSDSKIIGNGKTDNWIKDLRGNYIIIKHKGDEYSLLAHLKKGSILVEVGQKVRRKDIIAKCGNTGNSSEPHLHFQVQKGKIFFTSVGLPIRFINFSARLLETYNKITNLQVYPDELRDGFITRGFLVKNM